MKIAIVIIDASVVFKWFEAEPGSELALALILQERLFAPTLLLSEVGNALWKKARREQIDPAVSFEDELVGLTTVISFHDESLYVPRALSIARTLDHPIYDCVYVAMAETEDRKVITADKRFLAKIRRSLWSPLVEELA